MNRTARLSRINGKTFKFVRWETDNEVDLIAYQMFFSDDCPLGEWRKIHRFIFSKKGKT